MQESDDIELLRQYAERSSERAFATLVARHIDKVYSVALRHSNNPHQAEEITHLVFVILARKAPSLRHGVVLSGWLYQTARLTALTFIRSEIRRTHREQEAHMQSFSEQTEPDAWARMAPLLDAAIAELDAKDREAVVLRFFDGKSMKQVGDALSTSEDAAKKRVARAVEKLRHLFAQRGVVLPAAVLTSLISANSIQAAPAHLAASVATMVAAKGAAGGTSTLTLIKVLKLMAWTKAKTAAVTAAAVLLTAGTVTVAVKTGGFGIWKVTKQPRIRTDGINQAGRIPGAIYTYAQGDEKTRRYLESLPRAFYRLAAFRTITIKSDRELTEQDLQTRTICIYGTPENHSLFRRVRDQLPLIFEEDGIVVGNKKCMGSDVGAIFVCPSPFNPEHRLVIYGTVSPDALNNMNAVFHGPTDYVIFNNATRLFGRSKGGKSPEGEDDFLLEGAFDKSDPAHWRVDEALQLRPPKALQKATAGVVVAH
jgi:RNA polymerase sigma factor (sigma-70 family)